MFHGLFSDNLSEKYSMNLKHNNLQAFAKNTRKLEKKYLRSWRTHNWPFHLYWQKALTWQTAADNEQGKSFVALDHFWTKIWFLYSATSLFFVLTRKHCCRIKILNIAKSRVLPPVPTLHNYCYHTLSWFRAHISATIFRLWTRIY